MKPIEIHIDPRNQAVVMDIGRPKGSHLLLIIRGQDIRKGNVQRILRLQVNGTGPEITVNKGRKSRFNIYITSRETESRRLRAKAIRKPVLKVTVLAP